MDLHLDRLAQGQRAQVTELALSGPMRIRLQDIGLLPGTPIECVHRGRGIAAYRIRGCVMALRDCDADAVACVCTEDPAGGS